MESKTPSYQDASAHESIINEDLADGPTVSVEDLRFLRALRAEVATSSRREVGDAKAPRGSLFAGSFFDDDDARELSPRSARRLEKASEEVELQASMWDVSIFIGSPVAGCGASVYMALLLVVNICVQFSFADIVQRVGRDPALDDQDVDELKWWRRNVAHSSEYYNEAKGKTLARRVCDGDFGIEISGFQAVLHELLNDYLGVYESHNSKEETGFAPGKFLAMLACCLWIMSVFVDARAAVNTLIALHAMPKGETEIRLTKEGKVAIERLSRARSFAVFVVHMARIAVGVVLMWFGSIYLVHTIEISELILNAVALEFVLRVDELIYACFAPQRIKALIRHAKPLSAPTPFGSRGGVDPRSLVTFVLGVGIALAVYFGPVLSQERTLIDAQHVMCGGDLDFLYAVDGLGVPWWAATPDADEGLARFNFPNGQPRKKLKRESPNKPYDLSSDDVVNREGTRREQLIDVLLQQYGKPHFMDQCNFAQCDNYTAWGPNYPEPSDDAPACCYARSLRLPDPDSVINRAVRPFQEAAVGANPSGIDVLDTVFAGLVGVWRSDLAMMTPNEGSCRTKCGFDKPFCDIETRECVTFTCIRANPWCNAVNETGRRTRALCQDSCGCNFPQSPLALSLPSQGCASFDDSGEVRWWLGVIPCEDTVPSRDAPPCDGPRCGRTYDADLRNLGPFFADRWGLPDIHEKILDRWTLFGLFLDNAENAMRSLPLEDARLARIDIENLRQHGCTYLSDPTLWHTLEGSWSDLQRDGKNTSNGLSKPAYFLGRNICVRGGWPFKPLSLFCPEACGCHRGDSDCPTTCPARDSLEPACPEYQTKILAKEFYHTCAQQARRQPFNLGVPFVKLGPGANASPA